MINNSKDYEKKIISALRKIYKTKNRIKEYQDERTVLIMDIKGSTKLFTRLGEIEAAALIQKHRDLACDIITSFNAEGVPTGGDGLLAFFKNPVKAIKSACQIQQEFKKEGEIEIRMGLDVGKVLLSLNIQSMPIIIAARLMNLADGGQILTTDRVYQQVKTTGIHFHNHGGYWLEKPPEEIIVYEVLWEENQEPKSPSKPSPQMSASTIPHSLIKVNKMEGDIVLGDKVGGDKIVNVEKPKKLKRRK